ncbi:MAG TPA: glycosyltransferase [Ruminococcus sp.]|nr:glycosyltransferase [Ruminococcus sp.]HRU98123.1 glycosyltransferase [Ruminococcus sp.]
MIKVLHYAPGFRSGGIESRLLDWYRNIDRSKIQFVLIKLNNEDDTENMREFLRLGGKHYNLPSFTLKNYIAFSKGIKKIIKEEKIDVVHVHDVNSGYFVLKIAKALGVKCRILHSRTTEYLPNEKNLWIKKILKGKSYKYANHYFACSYEAGIWGIGEERKDEVIVIKNGIQTNYYQYDENIRHKIRRELNVENKKVIGSIGRLSPQKNIPYLLNIFNLLSQKHDDYVLVLVGEGNRKPIIDFIKEHGLEDKVILTGERKNVWDYYMAFDIFVGTSLYEGFGTTAIESQATGLPTILSTGFPEVVVLSNLTNRLSFDDANQWVSLIEAKIGKRNYHQGMESVISSGYSAESVAKYLQDFYEKNSK